MEDNFVLQNSGADKKPEFDVEAWLKLASDPSKQKAYEKGTVQKVPPRDGPVTVKQPIDVDGFLKNKQAPVRDVPMASPVVQEAPPANPIVETAREVIKEEQPLQEQSLRQPATVDEFAKQPMGIADWLVGLAPLAVDFIQGGANGMGLAADYYTKMGTPQDPKEKIGLAIQKLKLQTEQEKLKRKLATEGGKADGGEVKNSVMNLYKDEQGKVVYLPNAQALSRGLLPANEGQVATFWDTKGTDNGINRAWKSGENALDRASREKLAAQKRAEMMAKGRTSRDIKAFDNFTSKNSKYSQAEEKVHGSLNAMNMLNKGGVVGENGLPTVIAKQVFGEVGNLSVTDLQASTGDASVVGLANRLYQKLLGNGGKLGEEDRKDVEIVLRAAHAHNSWLARKHADGAIKGYRTMGVNTEALEGYVNLPEFPALQPRIPSTRTDEQAQSPRRSTNAPRPIAKGKVIVSNGKERREIDESDLAEAEKDKFYKVP